MCQGLTLQDFLKLVTGWDWEVYVTLLSLSAVLFARPVPVTSSELLWLSWQLVMTSEETPGSRLRLLVESRQLQQSGSHSTV